MALVVWLSLAFIDKKVIWTVGKPDEVFGLMWDIGHELFPDKANPTARIMFVKKICYYFG